MEKDRKPGGLPPMDDDMANELEVLRLMKDYQSGGKSAEVDKAAAEVENPAAPPEDDAPGAYALVFESPEAGEEAAAPRRKFTDALLDMLGNVVPKKGDAPLEIVRKCVFLIALLVLIGSVSYIVYDMVIVPANNDRLYGTLDEMYDPNNPAAVLDKYKDFPFPEGIDDAFKNIYPINTELRGWIKYNSNAKNDFLKISYPILYSGDNDKYLTKDFYENNNKNGALFFDKRNVIDTPASHNKVSIIYGHNMASGQMFSGINKFLNSVYNVRSAPLITMNTLYHRNEYKVFAVVMIDNAEKESRYRFNYLRTDFSGDADFLNFVNELRAHSIYDYNSVDVTADDDLLILSTCTNKSVLDDGRLAVVARRVRDGEANTVDTSRIVKNDDAIMPYQWYLNQKQDPHPFYTDPSYVIPTVNVTTTSSGGTGTLPAGTTASTTPTEGSTGTTLGESTTKPTTTTPVTPGTTSGNTPPPTTAPTTTTTTGTPSSETPSSGDTEAPTEPTSEAPTDPPTEPTEPTDATTKPSTDPTEETPAA